jgi:hypothetical protein
MTFPSNVNSFSPVFRQTILAASVRRIEVPHDTQAEANSLAAAMRSYVGKLYKAVDKDPALTELAQAARSCMFRVEGTVFIAQPRDMDTRFDRLKKALETPPAGDRVAEASLSALMASMENNAATQAATPSASQQAYDKYMGKS